jgi:hypothetical protein
MQESGLVPLDSKSEIVVERVRIIHRWSSLEDEVKGRSLNAGRRVRSYCSGLAERSRESELWQ